MSLLGTLWERIKTAIEGEATTVEATLTTLEQKLLPGIEALAKKIESTIGAQGLAVLEDALAGIAATIASGGNIGVGVSAAVKQATSTIAPELAQDAATAAHGALELLIAGLPPLL